MNQIDLDNNNLIKDIVLSHFGLDSESRDRFVEALENPEIDDVYRPFLGDDLRARFPVNRLLLENVDESWSLFLQSFQTYIRQFKPSYVDFLQGKIRHNKNILRIFKHLPAYYFEDERAISALKLDLGLSTFETSINRVREHFDSRLNQIIENRLPAKCDYEIVISRNFADFFLCSSAESWTSCLNLDSEWSGAYWSGLPGFIIDKNKAMIYITNKEKKDYLGIVTDKFITRSFLTVDQRDEIKALRWYPSDSFFQSKVFSKLPFKIGMFDSYGDKVKHPVKPLFFKNGWSCFAYQDKTSFRYMSEDTDPSEPRVLSSVEKGGQFYINRESSLQYHEGPYFFWEGGLRGLMQGDTDISDKKGESCCNCDGQAEGDNRYVVGGNIYCESCYNERYAYCEGCDQDIDADDVIFTDYGAFCQDCYDERFVSCESCGAPILKEDAGEENVCNRCRNSTTSIYSYTATSSST